MKLLDWTSLRTRISLGMLLAVLLTVWLATLLASRVLREKMEAAISAQQFSAVTLIASGVDQSLNERIVAIEELADHLSFSNAPIDQQHFLESLMVLPRMFNWGILILDAEGVAEASIPEHLRRTGINYRDMPIIQSALEQGQTVVSDPIIGKITEQPLFAICTPIRDSARKIRGLVVGTTNLAKPNFLDMVNVAKYGTTGNFFVIAPKSRRYVASSDKRRVMQVGPPVGVNPLYDRHLEGYEGSGVAKSSRGVVELSSSKRIPSVGWVMAAVLPADEAFAPIADMQRSLYSWALILTMLVGGITFLWLRRQFYPAREASKLLARMGDGSLPRQLLPVHRDDEIGQLANAFNGLLDRIVAEEERAVTHAANERLRKIVSHVPGVVFQYRLFPNGAANFPFVSEAFTDLYGVAPSEVAEDTDIIRAMVHPEDKERLFTSLHASADSLQLWRIDYRICRPDGVTKWLLVEAMPEPGNGCVTWYGSISDITAHKAVEDALRFTQFAVDKTIDQAFWMTEDGHIIYVNDAACHALEYSRAELLKLSVPDICPPHSLESYAQHWKKLKENGSAIIESFHQSKSGRMYPVEIRANYVIFDGKEYNCAFATDITERKKDEEEKIKLQAQLYQAQKMEAIGTLAGGIAHDFNNLLSVIFGYSELAKEDTSQGEKYHDYLKEVLTAANRAKELVKQILAFSRQTQVERIPLQIQPLIREGLKMLRSSIPTTISITEDIDPESGIILADPTQIHQILLNLCTNAYHSMEVDGGVLAVSLKTKVVDTDDQEMLLHVSPGEYAELMVSDTGSGIDPQIIERIFDPYFTTKESGKGTGMGLAIIHGIMQEYGGAITVESNVGMGAVFHVYFPVVNKAIEDEITRFENLPMGNERILLVDDEELLAALGKDLLERLGYRVTVQLSSHQALTTFQNAPNGFDLVITDQTMPEMTGAELAQCMLQIRPDIPIILCTGYSNLIDEHSAKALGIREFAFKPLSQKLLAKLIRNVLENK